MKKIEWNNKYTTIAVYVFLVVAACVLFGAAVQNFQMIWGFFFLSVYLYSGLH